MINTKFLVLIFLLFPTFCLAQNDKPSNQNGRASEYNSRLFYSLEKHNLKGSIMAQWLNFDSPNRVKEEILSLGWRSPLNEWWKWGFHAQQTTGIRRSDDWVVDKNTSPWNWSWKEKQQSKTYTLNPEWMARYVPAWNWGQTWVLEWRMEYYYHLHQKDQPNRREHGLKMRPGIFHTWSNSKGPWLTGTLAYEMDFSKGKNEKLLKEQSLYLGALFHLSKNVLVGPFAGIWKAYWQNSEDAKDNNLTSFKAEEKLSIIGINLNLYF